MIRALALLAVVALASGEAQTWRDRTQYDPTRHHYQVQQHTAGFDYQTRGARVYEPTQHHFQTQQHTTAFDHRTQGARVQEPIRPLFQTPQHTATFDFQNRGAKVHHHDHHQHKDVVVPQEYQEAHHAFSVDVLKNQYYTQTVENHGAVSINPFSFGHFLAIIHEKSFDLPVQNVHKVLRLPVDQISNAYHLHADAHRDDHKAYVTSQIFTSDERLVLTRGQVDLGVHKQDLLFAAQAPSIINSHIRVATHDIIDNDVVPNVPLLHKETTRGVVLNTFYYQNYFEYEFLNVGKKQFQTPARPVDVETLEVIGNFPVYETDLFSAVALPLESDGEDKHAVFVLPKTSLKQYLSSVALNHVFKSSPVTWVKKTIRVQLPHINITLAHNLDQYIVNENLVCSRDQVDLIQPIVQVTNFKVDHEEISYSVATAAQITANKQFRQNIPRTQHQRGDTYSNYNQFKQNTVIPTDHTLFANELILNKPFFTYFYDTTYGPFGYTAISHVFNHHTQVNVARHHENPFDFSEATKNARFTCEGQHH